MNITDQLEQIMLKVSDGFPAFKDYLRAKELVRKYLSEIPRGCRVLLMGTRKTDIDYVYWLTDDSIETQEVVVDFRNLEKPVMDGYEYDRILIVSYFGMNELVHELALTGIKADCLYDYFVINGLVLQHDWYDYIQAAYWDALDNASTDFAHFRPYYTIFYERKKYYNAASQELKTFHLKRMIFLCLHMRDFIYSTRYINDYIELKFDDANIMNDILVQIDTLMSKIKDALSNKTEKDTIMFWLDMLEYGVDKHMPFLNGLNDTAMVFENAYTVTSYTNPTLRTILCSKRVVDDVSYLIKTISIENSPLIQELDKNGVSYIDCGYSDLIIKKNRTKIPVYRSSNTGHIFWSAIEEYFTHNDPIFIRTHELNNTHMPFCSIANDGDVLFWKNDKYNQILKNNIIFRKQQLTSLRYTDEQLSFYSSLLPGCVNKIFFSDHGETSYGKWHSILKITGDKIKHIKITELFSYINFNFLIEWLYSENGQPLKSFFNDFVDIQDVDHYDMYSIQKILKKNDENNIVDYLGYRGVITENHIYIRRNDGFEKFYNQKTRCKPIPIEKLNELRELCGDYRIDPYSDEKFKYSRYLYETIDNYFNRTGDYEERKRAAIRELFGQYDNIALRTGGEAALQLLLLLYPDLNTHVKYIIDRDPDCIAGKFGGVDVLSIEQALEFNEINVVVIPTFLYREQMLTEDYGDKKVIDLYEHLTEKGFPCNTNFWHYDIQEEDIVYIKE